MTESEKEDDTRSSTWQDHFVYKKNKYNPLDNTHKNVYVILWIIISKTIGISITSKFVLNHFCSIYLTLWVRDYFYMLKVFIPQWQREITASLYGSKKIKKNGIHKLGMVDFCSLRPFNLKQYILHYLSNAINWSGSLL